MAGLGGGRKKRPSTSSSSCFSVATTVTFLAFCSLGVWMLSSSSSSSSSSSTTTSVSSARLSLRSSFSPHSPPSSSFSSKPIPSPPAFDDNPGDLPDDAIKADQEEDEQRQRQQQQDLDNEEEKQRIEEVVKEVREKRRIEEEEEKRRNEEAVVSEEEKHGEVEEEEGKPSSEEARGEDGGGGEVGEAAKEEEEEEEEEEGSGEGRQMEKVGGGGGGGDDYGGSRRESSYAPQSDVAEMEGADGRTWELCNTSAGADYIPCLDNEKALKKVHITGHFEHRERHCPEEGPACLVPLPKGYRRSIEWPRSRDKIWYNNVPHTKLAVVKGHQNWVKVTGEYLEFPGGGTQFIHGALHYIDFIHKAVPRIAWGKHTRVILDVGCGVASFGGYLFERDVLTMSFAPKDEHEAQVQFALERGIPAISAVMGTQRLPFPSRVFDIVHCARCRVPWHAEGGRLLLELNRLLRPGGYFVWSATPVYQNLEEDAAIWRAMKELTAAMCWDTVTIKKDRINSIGVAIYRKPVSNECYNNRKNPTPPMCPGDDDASAAWYVPLQACMHRVPIHSSERGSRWPEDWPRRLVTPPYWLNGSELSIYGKPAMEDFTADTKHWKKVVEKSYLNGMGISWSKIRNVMDMKAIYGGFAAALKDQNLWVMNVVNIDSHDTLPIIYERGLFGLYHDWCESFSTYPRSYDLLHADHLFLGLKKRCDILPVVVEVDRIVRPGGTFIIRDESAITSEVENLLKSLHWDVRMTFSEDQEGILCAEKTDWRPETFSSSS